MRSATTLSQPHIIETVHRRGYRFIAPIRSAPSASMPEPSALEAAELRRPARLLLGRESDLERLGEWLRAAVAGERQVVFVIGEAGMGKSALAEEFLKRVRTGETCYLPAMLSEITLLLPQGLEAHRLFIDSAARKRAAGSPAGRVGTRCNRK